MAKVKQEYVLEVTAKGLQAVVQEIKALRADMAGMQGATGKVSDGLNKVGKSAGEYDRNAKGAAKATNNSTKAFSKMAQGMSGTLVPAYATVAANVFALTAAFGALERAADTQILIKASEELAVQTGRSLTAMAKNMKEITGGAISMKEALTQASIAASAGFDNSTIEDLTQVARNASVALGRDLTDSMNRVFKGAIKAEPELLDELGIILRLDPAVRKYAASIGKAVKDLTTFEKQQAVVNEVITQGQDKFGKLSNVDPNPYTKLSAAFSDVTTEILKIVNTPLLPIITYLSENVEVLTGALLIFANTVIQRALPALTAFGDEANENVAKVLNDISDKLKTSDITADYLSAFNPDELKNAGDVFRATLESIDTAMSEVGKNLPEGLGKRLDTILSDKLQGQATKVRKALQEVNLELEVLRKTGDSSTTAFKKQEAALLETAGALKVYARGLKDLKKDTDLAESRITKFINIIGNLRENLTIIKASAIAGFGKGLSGGFLQLTENIKEFNKSLEATSARGKKAGAILKALSISMFSVSAAAGALVGLIPIIGQIIASIGILSSVFNFLTSKFRDNDKEIKTLSKAYETNQEEISKLYETTLNYRDNIKGLPDTIDNINKKLEVQNNTINTMVESLGNLITKQKALGDFGLWDKIFGFFGVGDIGKFTDSLETQLKILEIQFPAVRDQIEALNKSFNIDEISDLPTDKLLEYAEGLYTIEKAAKETANSQKDLQDKFSAFLKELDKSITAFTKLDNLTEAQKVFASLSDVLQNIDGKSIGQLGDMIANFSNAQNIEFGVSSEEAKNITQLSTGYNELTGWVNKTTQEIENLTKKNADLKKQQESVLQIADQNRWKKYQEQIDETSNSIDNFSESLKIAGPTLQELEKDLDSVVKGVLQDLRDQFDYFNDLITVQEKYGAALEKVKFLQSLPNNDLRTELDLIKEKTKLELEQNSILRARRQGQLETRRAEVARTAEAGSAIEVEKIVNADRTILSLRNELLATDQKSAQILQEQFNSLRKIVEEASKNETLGIPTEIPLTELVQNELLPALKDTSISVGQTNSETEKLLASFEEFTYSTIAFNKLNAEIGKSNESIAQTTQNIKNTADSYRIQNDLLRKYNGLIDERIDKELLIAEATALNDIERIKQELAAGTITNLEQQKELANKLVLLMKQLPEIEAARAAQIDNAYRTEKARLDLVIEQTNLELKYSGVRSKAAKFALDIEKKRLEYATQGYDTEKVDELIKKYTKLKKLEFKIEFDNEVADAIAEFSKLPDIIEDAAAKMELLTDPIDKMKAGFLGAIEIADSFGDDTSKGFAQIGLVLSDFVDDVKNLGDKGFEDLKESAIDAMSGLGSALQNAAGDSAELAKAGAYIDGVAAVVKAWSSAPFPYNLPMIAATVAGVNKQLQEIDAKTVSSSAGGAGTVTPQEYQAQTFGADNISTFNFQSNAFDESIDRLLDIEYKLYGSQKDLRNAIVNLKNSFDKLGASLFKAGGNFSPGDITEQFGIKFGTKMSAGFLGLTGSTKTTELLAAGIQLGSTIKLVGETLVGDINTARLFITTQVTKERRGWFSSSTSTKIKESFQNIDDDLLGDLQDALDNSLNIVDKLFTNFGLDVQEIFNNYELVLPTIKINLAEKSAEEQAQIISGYFSGVVNTMLKDTTPWLEEFSVAGEELLDTLIRLTERTIEINNIFSSIGRDIRSFAIPARAFTDYKEYVKQFSLEQKANAITKAALESFNTSLVNSWPTNDESLWFDSSGRDEFTNFVLRQTSLLGDTYQEVYKSLSEIMDVGQIKIRLYDPNFNDLRAWITEQLTGLSQLTKETWSDYLARIEQAWIDGVLENFGGDQNVLAEAFNKAMQVVFNPTELAQFVVDNLETDISNEITSIRGLGVSSSINKLLTVIDNSPDINARTDSFKQLWNTLDGMGAFIDAELFSSMTSLGAALFDLQEGTQAVEDSIDTFLRDILRQIELFGLIGKDLDLLQLQFDFEDAIAQAEGDQQKILAVEELYGLKRLDIIRSYNQEIVDAIESTSTAINDAMISVYESTEVWDKMAYATIKVDKTAKRLEISLGSLADGIDFEVFNSKIDTTSFEELFATVLKFEDEIPTNITDQIALVNQLKDAVLDRYNAEEKAIENISTLVEDIGDYLDSLKLSDLSPLTNVERLAEAQNQFTTNLANLNSTDAAVREKAQQDLTSSADTYLQAAQDYYGISIKYQDIFADVTSTLQSVRNDLLGDTGITPDTLAITALQQETLDQLATLDQILIVLESQNTTSYTDEVAAWAFALDNSVVLNNIVTRLESLESAVWATTLNAISVPAYQSGASEIEFDQIAKVHKGEMILTPKTAEEIRSGETYVTNTNNIVEQIQPTGSNEDIVLAIQILTQVLAASQEDLLEQGEKMLVQSSQKQSIAPTAKLSGII